MSAVYRAEVIGSLLRPDYLKSARDEMVEGTLATPAFKKIEDRAVDEAIRLQEEAGLDVVTGGEMRRSGFLGPLTDTLDGITPAVAPPVRWHGDTPEQSVTMQGPVSVTGKLHRRRSLPAEEFTYARAKASKPVKVTLPSPMMLGLRWSAEHSSAAYPDPISLFADAVDILRDEVRELANLGCQYIQIDAPELATLVDDSQRQAMYESRGISTARMLGEGIEMLNSIADASGVTFGIHMCRGNNQGRWISQGGYEKISKQVFQGATRFSVFLLEYDDWRSGSFEPLKDIPSDKRVVIGLISTKREAIEPIEDVVKRLEEAAGFFPREQLAVSTQCGFASILPGNPVSEEAERAKLRLVAEVANRV